MASRGGKRQPDASMASNRRLAELEAALAEGWIVEPPIVARPGWTNRHDAPLALHLVLALRERRRLLVIDDTPALRQFLADHQITAAVL